VLATLAIIIFGKSAAAFFLVRMFGHSPHRADHCRQPGANR
jgi:CPA2 family monovalent cation:H+ antiporter-2